jgi:urease accessory protein
MGTGFILALLGGGLPLVGPMILASVLLLGLAVALMLRPPLGFAASLVGLFGLFHGHAHGAELGAAGALSFGMGFALSTAVLHAGGLLIAWGYAKGLRHARLIRGLGWATALGGLWIAAGG